MNPYRKEYLHALKRICEHRSNPVGLIEEIDTDALRQVLDKDWRDLSDEDLEVAQAFENLRFLTKVDWKDEEPLLRQFFTTILGVKTVIEVGDVLMAFLRLLHLSRQRQSLMNSNRQEVLYILKPARIWDAFQELDGYIVNALIGRIAGEPSPAILSERLRDCYNGNDSESFCEILRESDYSGILKYFAEEDKDSIAGLTGDLLSFIDDMDSDEGWSAFDERSDLTFRRLCRERGVPAEQIPFATELDTIRQLADTVGADTDPMAACKSLDELSRVMKEDVVPRCLDFIMDILEDDFFTPDERAAVESLLKRPCVADSVKERRVSPSASTTSIRTADVDAEEPTARDDFHVPSDLYTLRFSRSSDHDGYFSECLIQDSQKLEEIIQVLANHGYIDAGDQRLLLYRLTGRCKPKDEDSSRKITWKGKENDLYYVLSLIKPEKKHHKEKMKEFFECGFSGIDSYSSRRRNASSTLKEDLNKIDPGIFRLYLETRLPPVATEERCRERQ